MVELRSKNFLEFLVEARIVRDVRRLRSKAPLYINGKLNNKDEIIKLVDNGKMIEDTKELVEVMNINFQSVFTREIDFNEPTTPEEGQDRLIMIRTTTQEVKLMLDGLDRRKATGPDNVSNWVFRECSSQLAEKICDMINTSLEQGKVPKDWKRADIVPIYKNGNRENSLNYRPISLTSIIAKLCERVVKK